MSNLSSQKIRSIQALRAIAVAMVTYSHAVVWVERLCSRETSSSLLYAFRSFSYLGNCGVDLFFVITGFLLLYLHFDDFGQCHASKKFILRRIIRIIPTYWLLNSIGFLLLFLIPSMFPHYQGVNFPWVLGCYFFFPWPQSTGESSPILAVAWTLNYEMHFYLLFAAALILRRKYGLTFLCTFLMTAVTIGVLLHPQHPWIQLLTRSIILEFVLGMLVFLLVSHFQPSKMIAWTLLCMSVASITLTAVYYPQSDMARVITWGVPSAVLLAAVIWLQFKCAGNLGSLLVVIGDASYSIYLLQVFSLPGLAYLFYELHLINLLPIGIMSILLWVVSCGAGVIFWRLVERPVFNGLKSLLGSSEVVSTSYEPTVLEQSIHFPIGRDNFV